MLCACCLPDARLLVLAIFVPAMPRPMTLFLANDAVLASNAVLASDAVLAYDAVQSKQVDREEEEEEEEERLVGR